MNPRHHRTVKALKQVIEDRYSGCDHPVSLALLEAVLKVVEAQDEKITALDQKLARVVDFIPHEDLAKAFPWLAEHEEYQKEGSKSE